MVGPNLLRAIQRHLEESNSEDQDPVNFIVRTFVLLAENHTVLMSHRKPQADIATVVRAFREQFQTLLLLAADSI